jgi:hypothetical protein
MGISSYQRRVLSGSRVEQFRSKHAHAGPGWLSDWTLEELAGFDHVAQGVEDAEQERQRKDADAVEAERVRIAALPKPRPLPNVKQRLAARRKHGDLWRKAAGNAKAFEQDLIDRLRAALAVAVARGHAGQDEVDAIMAELEAIGAEPA